MKPKKTTKEDELKLERADRRRGTERKPAETGTPSSEPERENDDTEAVPPSADSAEAEEEKARERAADDGMPDESAL